MLNKYKLFIFPAFILWVIAATPVSATPTALNNAYNADVTDGGALILYLSGDWGNNKYDDGHDFGASYGLMGQFEIGFSWRLTAEDDFRQDPTFDAKFRFDLGGDKMDCEGDCADCGGCDTTGVAIGVDNINFDEDALGNFVPYIVYTHDFDGMRGHAGYAFEEDNGAIFVGLDHDTGDATLMWDWMQIDDGEDWQTAFGFSMPFQWLDDNWCFTSNLTFSSNSTHADVWYAEFSYEIP